MDKLKSWALSNKYLLALIGLATLIRFNGLDLPALMDADSVKYAIPLQIIKLQRFEWLFDHGINFSPLYRSISYFLQTWTNGSVDIWVPIQKILGIIESVLVYLMAIDLMSFKAKQSKSATADYEETEPNHKWAFIVALLFALNPLALFWEHFIMAESLFIFFMICSAFFILKLSDAIVLTRSSGALVSKSLLIYSSLLGLSIAMVNISKDITIWKMTIIGVLLIFAIKEFVQENKLRILIAAGIISLGTLVGELPLRLSNQKHFGVFSVQPVPIMGGTLWNTNEAMINRSNAEPKWIVESLKLYTQYFKQRDGKPLDQLDRVSFQNAITTITVMGRQGNFVRPDIRRKLTPKQFSDAAAKFLVSISLEQPGETFTRMKKCFYYMFLQPNFTFKTYVPASRKDANFAPLTSFLRIPSSLDTPIPSQVKDLPLVDIANLTEKHWYKDESHTEEYQNAFPLMLDRESNKAFMYNKPNLLVSWMDMLRYIPYGYFVLPIFLLAIIVFFASRQFLLFDLKQYFLLGHSIFFVLLITATSIGTSRYSLYVIPTMLLFILSSFVQYKKTKS